MYGLGKVQAASSGLSDENAGGGKYEGREEAGGSASASSFSASPCPKAGGNKYGNSGHGTDGATS